MPDLRRPSGLHARTARLFAASGIELGDRVAICSENDVAVIALYLSAMRVGVTPALIDPNSSADEALALVRAARAKAVFVDQTSLNSGARFDGEVLQGGRVFPVAPGPFMLAQSAIGGVAAAASIFPGVLSNPGSGADLPDTIPDSTSAFFLFTSGTTSRPKGVEVSLGAVTSHMMTKHRQYGDDEQTVVMNNLPLHHSDGINCGPVNIMAAGDLRQRTGVHGPND